MTAEFFLDVRDSGTGPAIIFTHGWTDNRSAWDDVIESLQDEARCLAWSIRGHGNSFSPPPGEYTRDHTLSDLKLITEKSEGKVILAGHSLGGYLSLAHCLLHPENVAALILVGAGPGFRKKASLLPTQSKSGPCSEDLDSNQTSSQVVQPRPSSKSLSISKNSLELSSRFFLLPNVRILCVMSNI